MPNFIALGIYFIFGTKFNEGIETCFNVECVFLGGYLVVTALYLVASAGYCLLPGGYWWLLLVTGGDCSFPVVTARSHFQYELRSSRSQVFFKKGILKNVAKFTGKHL